MKTSIKPLDAHSTVRARIRELAAFALVVAVLSLLAGCPGNQGKDPDAPDSAAKPADTSPVVTTHPAPHEAEPGEIKDNPMHDTHLVGGIECGDCHDPEYPLDHEQALRLCNNCHDQTVVKPVWNQHCLTCHHFTYSNEDAATDPLKVGSLCHDCHIGDEASNQIYAFIHPDELHNITCARCHHPHESEEVASPEFCIDCHPDLAGIKHPVAGGATCQQCHNPHIGGRSGTEICSSCHVPDERVLVHLIPSHPDDCLACHSPHFDETEILGTSCLGCHDGMYYAGGENQPRQHKDCENCHWISDWQYKSDHVCGECHIEEGWLIENKDLPSQHRNCLTCHHPHTWRAPFTENCVSCHETDTVLEHRLSFHGETCDTCHNPHLTDEMPKSGNCSGCHGPKIPEFLPDATDEHAECANCHGVHSPDDPNFKFAGDAATCIKCHAKPGAEHEHDWDKLPIEHRQCHVCHPAHTFPSVRGVADTCQQCHQDKVEVVAGPKHRECFNCHSHDHNVEFRGRSVTCIPCHAEAASGTAHTAKEDCLSCHPVHNFAAKPIDCASCHQDIKSKMAGSGMEDCSGCHSQHRWHPGRNDCIECHDPLPADHAGNDFYKCETCHPAHDYKVIK